MKGWQIFLHSLRQVTGNFEAALRVSALLYLVQFATALVAMGGMMGPPGALPDPQMAGLGLGMIVVLLVAVVTSLWIAVGWHRYVLQNELSGLIPTFRGDRMLAYFLRSLGYGLILIIGGVVWGMLVGLGLGPFLGASTVAAVVLIALFIQLPIVVLGFRLTAALPATALGRETAFMAGWAATKGQTGDLIGLAVICVLAIAVLELIGIFVFGSIMILSLLWSLATGWLTMMVGVSILTTLYGHYIEKRALV